MKNTLKIWALGLLITLSFNLVQAEELPTHGVLAPAKSEIEQNVQIIQAQMAEMNSMQDELSQVEDTEGLMGALGQTIAYADIKLQDIQKNKDTEESKETVLELRLLIQDFKGMNPLNRILGVHVSHELSF